MFTRHQVMNAFSVFFMMSLFLSIFSVSNAQSNTWYTQLPDFQVRDIEVLDGEVVVWFQNNGIVEMGKKYYVDLKLGEKVYRSEELLMLGTHALQGYSFQVDELKQKGKSKRVYAQAHIDPDNRVNELSENNIFHKMLLLN